MKPTLLDKVLLLQIYVIPLDYIPDLNSAGSRVGIERLEAAGLIITVDGKPKITEQGRAHCEAIRNLPLQAGERAP